MDLIQVLKQNDKMRHDVKLLNLHLNTMIEKRQSSINVGPQFRKRPDRTEDMKLLYDRMI